MSAVEFAALNDVKTIDDELAGTVEDSRKFILLRARNHLTRINQFPPEILGKIFEACSHHYLDTLTRVCSYWRGIALHTPQLWCIIDSSIPGVVRRCVELSGALPLSLSLSSLGDKPETAGHVLELALGQLYRVQSLVLCVRPNVVPRLKELLSTPAPILKSFSISIERRNFHHSNYKDLATKLSIPHAPVLTSIYVQWFGLDWSSPILSDLRHLYLWDIARQYRPTAAQLQAILTACSRLNSLSLMDALPEDVSPWTTQHLQVALPHLMLLRLGGKYAHMLQFLLLCDVAPGCKLFVESTNGDQFNELILHRVREIVAGRRRHAQTVCISLTHKTATLSAWEKTIELPAYLTTRHHRLAPKSLEITMNARHEPHEAAQTLLQLSYTVPKLFIRSLGLALRDDLDESAWRSLLAGYDSVQTLVIDASLPRDPPAALTCSIRGFFLAVHYPDILPRLQRLLLCGVPFGLRDANSQLVLVSALRHRNMSAKLELELTDCWGLNESIINQLTPLVCQLEWDGMMQGFGKRRGNKSSAAFACTPDIRDEQWNDDSHRPRGVILASGA